MLTDDSVLLQQLVVLISGGAEILKFSLEIVDFLLIKFKLILVLEDQPLHPVQLGENFILFAVGLGHQGVGFVYLAPVLVYLALIVGLFVLQHGVVFEQFVLLAPLQLVDVAFLLLQHLVLPGDLSLPLLHGLAEYLEFPLQFLLLVGSPGGDHVDLVLQEHDLLLDLVGDLLVGGPQLIVFAG